MKITKKQIIKNSQIFPTKIGEISIFVLQIFSDFSFTGLLCSKIQFCRLLCNSKIQQKKIFFPRDFSEISQNFQAQGCSAAKNSFMGCSATAKSNKKKYFSQENSPKFHRFFSEISSNFQTQGCSAAKNSFMGCSAAEKKN